MIHYHLGPSSVNLNIVLWFQELKEKIIIPQIYGVEFTKKAPEVLYSRAEHFVSNTFPQ